MNKSFQHIHFVTGRLAEFAVRSIVEKTAQQFQFHFSISVLPITVAALMTPKWLLRHLEIPAGTDRLIIPGHLESALTEIRDQITVPVVCGPRDIRDLPRFFGDKQTRSPDYGEHSIEIIAEINHADRLDLPELIAVAERLQHDGADVIDLGCSPGNRWLTVGDAVSALIDLGIRVSIDSFDIFEVSTACRRGAELVLSVNSTNRSAAVDWGTEVVAVPDDPVDEKIFAQTINFLIERDILFRIDPILEPIGCGFARSLGRYLTYRHQFPHIPMMMGIGNITELTDADSSAINVLLLGICQELDIQSVLTTQAINWARTAVKECALARQLVYYACKHGIPPKRLEASLILLRDDRVNEYSVEELDRLSHSIRDKNIRLHNAEGRIHAIAAGVHESSHDPFEAMQNLLASSVGDSINREHAFYLGFEMAKAMIANCLHKQYDQDQPLNWGFLTQNEPHRRLNKHFGSAETNKD